MGYRAVLRDVPQLKPLLAGYTASTFGDAAQLTALLWLAARPPVDALRVSVVVLASIAPGAFLGFWTSAIGDAVRNRRGLLIGCDVALAGLATALAVLETGAAFWAIVADVAVMSAIDAAASATYAGALPEVVGSHHLGAANGLYRSSAQLAGIGGAATGGLLVATLPAPYAFALNALSFLISAIAMTRVPKAPFAVAALDERGSLGASYAHALRRGWRFMRTVRPVRLLVAVGVLGTIGFSPAPVALVVLIRTDLHGDGAVYGAAQALTWVGLASGALLAGAVGISRSSRLFGLEYLVLAVCTLVLGLAFSWWLALACVFGRAAANGMTSLTSRTLLQQHAPGEVRSAVMGAVYGMYEIPRIVLLPLAGVLVDIDGVRVVYAGMAFFIGAAGLLALVCGEELSAIGAGSASGAGSPR